MLKVLSFFNEISPNKIDQGCLLQNSFFLSYKLYQLKNSSVMYYDDVVKWMQMRISELI